MTQVEASPPVVTRRRHPWRNLALIVVALLIAVVAYLAFAPSPVDPLAYEPPPAPPLDGLLAPNNRLSKAEVLAEGEMIGAEDVEIDADGNVYGGTLDGRIVRLAPDGTIETFAETGGRPLGMEFDADGNLIVADAVIGLLSVNPDGKIEVLSTGAEGVPFGFPDDVDVAPDGKIYFSDASSKFGEGDYLLDMLEGRPHGRLLCYDLETGETDVLADGLYFANGIAVSSQNDFVLVNETYRTIASRDTNSPSSCRRAFASRTFG